LPHTPGKRIVELLPWHWAARKTNPPSLSKAAGSGAVGSVSLSPCPDHRHAARRRARRGSTDAYVSPTSVGYYPASSDLGHCPLPDMLVRLNALTTGRFRRSSRQTIKKKGDGAEIKRALPWQFLEM